MIQPLGNSYLIMAELPVKWVPTAAHIPAQSAQPTMYPVWMLDASGTRAAIFVRCPACGVPLGLAPGNEAEQRQWNKKDAEVTTLVSCDKCAGFYMLTDTKALLLSLIPPQKTVTTPRPWGEIKAQSI